MEAHLRRPRARRGLSLLQPAVVVAADDPMRLPVPYRFLN